MAGHIEHGYLYWENLAIEALKNNDLGQAEFYYRLAADKAHKEEENYRSFNCSRADYYSWLCDTFSEKAKKCRIAINEQSSNLLQSVVDNKFIISHKTLEALIDNLRQLIDKLEKLNVKK